LDIFEGATKQLVNNSPAGLTLEEQAPVFTLAHVTGENVNLYQELKKGPVS
jgi:hypothetical protein